MGTFSVQIEIGNGVTMANSFALEAMVDTGASYLMIPADLNTCDLVCVKRSDGYFSSPTIGQWSTDMGVLRTQIGWPPAFHVPVVFARGNHPAPRTLVVNEEGDWEFRKI